MVVPAVLGESACSVLVTVDIKADRLDDFLKAMRADASGSRDRSLDPGARRFDLLRSADSPNRFYFYEVYNNDDGAAQHKTTAHYNAWADFKKSGGVEHQEVEKLETASIPGGWALQANDAAHSRVGIGVIVVVDIEADRIEAFLEAMKVDLIGSRTKSLDPGCLRFDLLRFRDEPNKFMFYEAYTDEAGFAKHKTTKHFAAWASFKEAGGVKSQTVRKFATTGIPGTWAFQAANVEIGTAEMPLLGFGTYKVGTVPASASSAAAGGAPAAPGGEAECKQVIADALDTGYAMLDCAQFYENERWVGEAVQAAGVPRANLCIASKVWNDVTYQGAAAVKAQVDKTIKDLGCGYLDLMLVHWPVPGKHVDAYNALRECKALGKVKNIGVSNYCVEDYEELRAAGAFGARDVDRPVCNQIEVNPLLFRKRTIEFFKREGVHIQAYRGLCAGPKAWEFPALQEICRATGKAPPQVLGRFLLQQGISHIPKASTRERMAQNADLFGFELSVDQMAQLSNLTTKEALEVFQQLYVKCIWRDTPQAGSPWTSARTLE